MSIYISINQTASARRLIHCAINMVHGGTNFDLQ